MNDINDDVILAIVENRSREVSIALININQLSILKIIYIRDNRNYTETMRWIDLLEPKTILLHDGLKKMFLTRQIINWETLILNNTSYNNNNNVNDKVDDINKNQIVKFVSRKYFDQDNGIEKLKDISLSALDPDLVVSYISLAASYCLIKFIENKLGIRFASSSVKIEYNIGNHNKMVLDRTTYINLEIISNSRTGNQKDSLFGIINQTKTSMGARLLRSTLLNPCNDLSTINLRLDIVQFFLSDEQIFNKTMNCLMKFSDLDRMLNGLTRVSKQITKSSAQSDIETLICLKHTLLLVPELANILNDGINRMKNKINNENNNNENNIDDINVPGQALLNAMINNFQHDDLDKIRNDIQKLITESTTFTKNSHQMKHQECFAVRPDINGLLDISRKAFLQSIEEIYRLANEYEEELNWPIKVVYTASRGYHLSLPLSVLRKNHILNNNNEENNNINNNSNINNDKNNNNNNNDNNDNDNDENITNNTNNTITAATLPDIFVQAVQHRKYISCSTEDIISFSDRSESAIQEALILTHETIQDLMNEIRKSMNILFSLTEAVALLDMLFGFADLVTISPIPLTRPNIKPSDFNGPLVIKGGYHPIAARFLNYPFVPNDIITHQEFFNFHIITGANGAGKSTYLKQIGLIIIMAQSGSYVPVLEYSTIPIRNRIFTRLGTSDDMENNISTFLMEMKDIVNILKNDTKDSLILIDELGRGTSTIEGLSIAWSISEKLINKEAITLFVTHFHQLTNLSTLYPNVKNLHISKNNSDNNNLADNYKMKEGSYYEYDGYGIRTAIECGFPEDVIENAKLIKKKIKSKIENENEYGIIGLLIESENLSKNYFELVKHIVLLKETTLDNNGLKTLLLSLKSNIKDKIKERIIQVLKNINVNNKIEENIQNNKNNNNNIDHNDIEIQNIIKSLDDKNKKNNDNNENENENDDDAGDNNDNDNDNDNDNENDNDNDNDDENEIENDDDDDDDDDDNNNENENDDNIENENDDNIENENENEKDSNNENEYQNDTINNNDNDNESKNKKIEIENEKRKYKLLNKDQTNNESNKKIKLNDVFNNDENIDINKNSENTKIMKWMDI